MAAVRQVGENFSRFTASRFGLLVKAKVSVHVGAPEQIGWEDFEASTAGHGVLAAFSLGEGQVFVHVPAILAMSLVDLYLAGTTGTGPFPDRPLSETESRLFSPFLSSLTDGMADAASSIFGATRGGPVTQMTGTSGLFLSNRRMPCVALQASVQLPSVREPSGNISICLPVSTLRPLLVKLQPTGPTTESHVSAVAAAMRAPLTLSLRYPQVAIRFHVAQSLSPGQVVSLRHQIGEPLLLCAEDKPLFTAVPVEHGKRAACRIVDVHEPQKEKGEN
jgi:flagellar motor switch protein FliM